MAFSVIISVMLSCSDGSAKLSLPTAHNACWSYSPSSRSGANKKRTPAADRGDEGNFSEA